MIRVNINKQAQALPSKWKQKCRCVFDRKGLMCLCVSHVNSQKHWGKCVCVWVWVCVRVRVRACVCTCDNTFGQIKKEIHTGQPAVQNSTWRSIRWASSKNITHQPVTDMQIHTDTHSFCSELSALPSLSHKILFDSNMAWLKRWIGLTSCTVMCSIQKCDKTSFPMRKIVV